MIEHSEGFARKKTCPVSARRPFPGSRGYRAKLCGCLFAVAELLLNVSFKQQKNAVIRILGKKRRGSLCSARVIEIIIAKVFGHVESCFHLS